MTTELLEPKLKDVPQTMLISLRARYLETKTEQVKTIMELRFTARCV